MANMLQVEYPSNPKTIYVDDDINDFNVVVKV